MKNIPTKAYQDTLSLIQNEIEVSRTKAVIKVNEVQMNHYMNIGAIIHQQQNENGWGKSIVEQLSRDLKNKFPNTEGYSSRNLWDMRKFFSRYSANEKLRQLVAEIPWGHNLLIMQKIKDDDEAEFYIKSSKEFGWSRNVLLNQIKANSYVRSLSENKQHNFNQTLPEHLSEQADETIKSSYSLDFLGLSGSIKEADLEVAMISKIKDVLLELGQGFAFIGNQYKLSLGEKDYYLDLLFYHRKLQCLVVVELKAGEFKPEYAGKLNFYLELLDNIEKEENENPSIGILLCASKNTLEVEYALRTVNKPIGISEYQLTKDLPKALREYLPDEEELIKKLK
ncbi:YhcG family protein [Flammeovirga sp. OC4]|uniref:PDDEXK nuclease domain-containing protein n=1 Tax=Flammeovirga sp. OC4 TaxID=1382345 RepID=UPI0005C535D7|nr:PDDEXK nuclease domain-containing protein [Flammeovirga sp. OC4]